MKERVQAYVGRSIKHLKKNNPHVVNYGDKKKTAQACWNAWAV
jgi:hypothetical protein